MDDILPSLSVPRTKVFHMSSILLALSLLVSTSFAKDLPPGAHPLKAVGAVVDFKDCEIRVLASTMTAAKTAETVISAAEAQRICAESKGDLVVAFAEAMSTVMRAPAEAYLISDLGLTARAGGNIRIKTDALEAEAGDHLNWQAYGTAIASADPYARYDGQMGYVETDPYMRQSVPDLYRLSGGQGGVVTPLLPGVSMTPATADCGTLAECDALAKRQAAFIAAQAKAK